MIRLQVKVYPTEPKRVTEMVPQDPYYRDWKDVTWVEGQHKIVQGIEGDSKPIFECDVVFKSEYKLRSYLRAIKKYYKKGIQVQFLPVCCYDCYFFYHQSPQADQPYPEFVCGKGHWDGVSDPESLLKPIECKDFKP